MLGQIFLSYASPEDSAYVASLAARLEASGAVRAWYYERDEPAGVRFRKAIIDAIDASLALVVIISRHSAFSEPIEREVNLAQSLRKPLIAIVIGAVRHPRIDEGLTRSPLFFELRIDNLIDARGGGDPVQQLVSALRALAHAPATPRPTVLLREALAAQVAPTRRRDLSGQTIRGIDVLEVRARTEMSVVYEAVEQSPERRVALKAIHPDHADDEAFQQRFRAEAQRIADLAHPHIVPLYSSWADATGAFLVMPWMAGGTLNTWIGRPNPPGMVARIVSDVGQALIYAHRKGVIHLDIKPGNILLDEAQNAFLSDFGISIRTQAGAGARAAGLSLGYAPPEQYPDARAQAAPLTMQADIYSLGVVVVELLLGQRLFQGADGYARQRVGLSPDTLERLPAPVAPVLQRALAPEAAARHPDMLSFVRELLDALRAARSVAHDDDDEPAAATPDAPNPYMGIAPFREQDASFFFGREAAVEALLALLAQPSAEARFLAVAGASGSGKSSLVRAGLIPELRKGRIPGSEHWRVRVLTPGGDPLESLASALAAVGGRPRADFRDELAADTGGLFRAAASILPTSPAAELLLVIDQFEELFTQVADPRLRRYVLASLLTAVRDSTSRLRIVVTLRGDFYDRPLQESEFARLVLARTFWVEPLSDEELEDAIVRPAKAVGVGVQRTLVREILADMAGQPGMLPLLQYTLAYLFERREDGPLSLQNYRSEDGVRGTLSRRAAAIFADLSPQRQRLAQQLFLRLVTPGEGVADARFQQGVTDFLFHPDDSRFTIALDTGEVYQLNVAFFRAIGGAGGSLSEAELTAAACRYLLHSEQWTEASEQALRQALLGRAPQVCAQ